MQLRRQLLSADGCSFSAQIVADYGDELHTFAVDCQFDEQGDLSFMLTAPESISGITGTVTQEEGNFTFKDRAVAFPLLADGQLTPVSAPWVFMNALRSGYINSCTGQSDLAQVCIDDSFYEDSLQVDLWLDEDHMPVQAEILHNNRRILSLQIADFVIE